jgi:uncharacterized membrane protein YfcA
MLIATTVGGAGMIVVPALIFLGLPPHAAIATTRIGILCGDVAVLPQLKRAGKVQVRLAVIALFLGMAGAIIGAEVLLWTPSRLTEKLLGGFILLMVIYGLLQPNMGLRSVTITSPLKRATGYASIFLLSILSAYFSAATGLLGRTALMACFGQTYLESAATRKVQSLGIGLTSSFLFLESGAVNLSAAIALAPGMIAGSIVGMHVALKKGDAWVRRIFMGMVVLAAALLILK